MDIILTPHQQDHANKTLEKFSRFGKFLDTSITGSGKSIIFIWIIKQLQIQNIIMICPNSMIDIWENYKLKYNIPFKAIITYESLRGIHSYKM